VQYVNKLNDALANNPTHDAVQTYEAF
jgi:hypothetical protein